MPRDLAAPDDAVTVASTDGVRVSLPAGATAALLQRVPQAYRTQINDVLLTALAQAVAAWAGGSCARIALEGHGREDLFEGVDLSRTVGWFTTLCPVVIDIDPERRPGEALRSVKEQLRRVPHHGIGHGLLLHLGPPEARAALSAVPPPELSFNYLGQLDATVEASSLLRPAEESVGPAQDGRARRPHLVDVTAMVIDGRLRLDVAFSTAVHARATIDRLAQDILRRLEALIEHCLSPEAGGFTPSDFPLIRVDQAALDRLAAEGGGVEDVYRLSPMQQGMLFHAASDPGSGAHVEQLRCTVRGLRDVAAFERAWRRLLELHPILRTSFHWDGLDEPAQVVRRRVELPVAHEDWRACSDAEAAERLAAYLTADRARGFDLTRAPLLRLLLAERADGAHTLVWTHHHILMDGWCIPLVLRDLFALYEAEISGAPARIEAPARYRDYIAWLGRQDRAGAEAFWRERLRGFEQRTRLDIERARPDSREAGHGRVSRRLPAGVGAALAAQARRHHLTVSTLVHGAWALLLHHHGGADDVVFGSTTSGRPAEVPGVESMVGLFINTLPIRVQVDRAEPVAAFLRRLMAQQVDLRSHESLPLWQVQTLSDLPRGEPLFDTLLVFENYPVDEAVRRLPGGLRIDAVEVLEQTTYPVAALTGPGEDMPLTIHHDRARVPAEAAERLLDRWSALLEAMAEGLERPVGELPAQRAEELRRLVVERNATAAPFPDGALAHELFEARADERPGALALVLDDERVTYAELDARANRIAHHLRGLGVGAEARVALCLARSVDLVAAQLGALKAGAAYLPLDPSYPRERLRYMLADSGARVLVTHGDLGLGLDAPGVRTVRLDEDRDRIAAASAERLPASVPASALAYVIYTSGSTGAPKGVLLAHRGLCNLAAAQQRAFGVGPGDHVLQLARMGFDASVWETFMALASGAALHLAPDDALRAGPDLARLLRERGITVLTLTPSALSVLPDEPLPALRQVIVAGEACPPDLARRWSRGRRFVNAYGPTETTVCATMFPVESDGDALPIGRPIQNTRVYVLDRHLQPVPEGVPGELCVGGAGVARGYAGRAALSAERFVPDPFSGEPGARLYRTGDLARWRADGELEFLGRIDHQVKIRGHRVELGEIEAALAAHPGVREAVVLAREVGEGDTRLWAYLLPEGEAPAPEVLRAHLERMLPEYMLPSVFVALAAWPVTPNGKLDRRALPAPSAPGADATDGEAPRTPVEQLLQGAFAEVLRLPRVGLHDDFFALGGHSLLATQLVSRVRAALRVELPLRALFDAPTVAGLAARVEEERRRGEPPPPPLARAEPDGAGAGFPLSFAQQRLWFLDQLEPGGTQYNIPVALRIRGELDVEAMRRAFEELVRRHEALRTTVVTEGGEPSQVIHPPAPWALPVVDWAGRPEAAADEELGAHLAEQARRPFDLAAGPLFRTALYRLGDGDHALLVDVHHIVSDGWSTGVLVREFAALYAAFTRGEAPSLPELPVRYADYAVWQRAWLTGPVLERQLAYWKGQLAGVPALDLPTDRARPPVQTHRAGRHGVVLSSEIARRLHGFCRAHGVTLFMALLAALEVLLARQSGQDDFCVGTPIAGRRRGELESLVGFFVNTLALRADLSGEPSFLDVVARVREASLDAYAHQDVPFERVIEALQPARDLSRTPLFQVFFNLINVPFDGAEPGGLAVREIELGGGDAKFDLTLYAVERGDEIALDLVYNADLFGAARAAELMAGLASLVEQVLEQPDRPVRRCSLVTARSRDALPDPAAPLVATPAAPFIGRFVEQARRAPDRVAIDAPGTQLTYGALLDRSAALAQDLRAGGIGKGDLVAIFLPRSADLVAALLGVALAGAAFVVLDPAHPAARLAACLGVAAPRGWVEAGGAAPLPPELERVAASARCRARVPDGPVAPAAGALDPGIGPDDLAYVAFTSGTTGEPKAIAATHGPLAHFLAWHVETSGLTGSDRFSALSGLGHDPLLRDVFTPLCLGATLCVPGADLARLGAWMAEQRVTVAHLTPAMGRVLAAGAEAGALPALRLAFFGGEALGWGDVAALERLAPAVRAVNFYGATETPQAMAAWSVPAPGTPERARAELRPPPVGRGIEGAQLLVVNAAGQPCGVGELGEIWIRTPYLSRGYLGDDALTQARFVRAPGALSPGDRAYRTGDLGRHEIDGTVTWVGRRDAQVKVRGHRVELGEIEAALAAHPQVREAVVIAAEHAGALRLVAYVVAEGGEAPSAEQLRAHLGQRLPEPMIPGAWVHLDRIPLTPSGKVDRRALPAPSAAPIEAAGGDAPATPAEEIVADLFAELLGIERPGRRADFFLLGGHSLLATQLASRVRRAFGVELPLRAVFEARTVEALTRRVETLLERGAGPGAPAITRAPREGGVPLSFAQQRLWFLAALTPGGAAYNMPFALRLSGELDVAALRGAFEALLRRHEALRTTFEARDGVPAQRIHPPGASPLAIVDLTALPAAERDAEARRLGAEEARRPFDLGRGPLFRATLVRLGAEDHALLITMHHIVSDGWSIGVLVRELTAHYEALVRGGAPALPDLPVQYADFAAWQRAWLTGDALERQLAYWRGRLAGVAPLELPTDRPRPASPSWRGASVAVEIPEALTAGVRALARGEGVTVFMVLLAAFQALLGRMSGQDDVAIGSPVAGRTRAELEGLIGFFVNTLVLRADLSQNPAFSALLAQVKETTLGAYAHQDVPFEKLVEELAPARDLSRQPLFQVMLTLQNLPFGEARAPGLRMTPLSAESGAAQFDLTLSLHEQGGRIQGRLEYALDLFDAGTAERIAERFGAVLEAVVRDPSTRVAALPILTAPERDAIARWNATAAPFPEGACVPELFEAQVQRTPAAIAVASGDERMTYAELDAAAGQLARRLLALGAGGPDARVAVCLDRSVDLVVALLGVLRAGAAYVPLDPAYPPERLAHMLTDSGAAVLVTRRALAGRADPAGQGGDRAPGAAAGVRVLCLDEPASAPAPAGDPDAAPAGRVPPRPHPRSLAYVIYTSGSTGKPKGVMVPHRAVSAFFAAMDERVPAASEYGVWLAVTSVCFDISVLELLWTLTRGFRVVLLPDTTAAGWLAREVERHGVTHLQCTPSLAQALLLDPASAEAMGRLRALLVGGEALSRELARRLLERVPGRLVNMYGPTETTIWSSTHAVRDASGPIPLGAPIANTALHVLDRHLAPLPAGAVGELYIGGEGVVRGYHARPGLTAERFLPDPFSPVPGARMYRTGDLVRRRPDGLVEFIGRADHQIKLRGHRIELGEIEAALAAHPRVREAVVVVKLGGPGGGRLVAYVLADGDAPAPEELRAHLARTLPEPMVPSAYVALDAWPLLPNGKLDRAALPDPARARAAPGGAPEEPRTPVERVLAGIVAELLRLPDVGVQEDFFALGGNSLLGMQLVARVRSALGVEVPVRALFEAPTVAALAARVEAAPRTGGASGGDPDEDREEGEL